MKSSILLVEMFQNRANLFIRAAFQFLKSTKFHKYAVKTVIDVFFCKLQVEMCGAQSRKDCLLLKNLMLKGHILLEGQLCKKKNILLANQIPLYFLLKNRLLIFGYKVHEL